MWGFDTLRDFPLGFYWIDWTKFILIFYIMHIFTFVIIDTSQVWDLFNPLHVQRPAAFLCRKSPFGSRERPGHDKLQSCWASAFASHCWACEVCNLMWWSLGLAAGFFFGIEMNTAFFVEVSWDIICVDLNSRYLDTWYSFLTLGTNLSWYFKTIDGWYSNRNQCLLWMVYWYLIFFVLLWEQL